MGIAAVFRGTLTPARGGAALRETASPPFASPTVCLSFCLVPCCCVVPENRVAGCEGGWKWLKQGQPLARSPYGSRKAHSRALTYSSASRSFAGLRWAGTRSIRRIVMVKLIETACGGGPESHSPTST